MAENADFSSLLEEIKENMPELYQEMEAYAQRTGKSLAELSKDEAFVSRYSARYSERKDAVTALDNAVDEEIAGAGSEEDGAVAYVDGSYHIGTKEFSCGAVLFLNGEELHFSEKVHRKADQFHRRDQYPVLKKADGLHFPVFPQL